MTKVATSTVTWANEPGTSEQVVARYVANGWEAVQAGPYTALKHPSLTGTQVLVEDDL